MLKSFLVAPQLVWGLYFARNIEDMVCIVGKPNELWLITYIIYNKVEDFWGDIAVKREFVYCDMVEHCGKR